MYCNRLILCFVFYVILALAESSIQTTQNITYSTPKMVGNESTPVTYPWNRLVKSLWLHRPEALQPYHSSHAIEAPSHVVQRHPFFLIKLTRPLRYGVSPCFPKIYFEPFERRKKPVVILALQKHGIAPIKVSPPNRSSVVAVLQSPYNEIDDQAVDDTDVEVQKTY